ncbi:MAG: hypothetical protein BYD32DRAFT_136360 [Podila humilis]|nr:MAG: hypothetical protein BYD32DRAFT_136360 [Podila humilis]
MRYVCGEYIRSDVKREWRMERGRGSGVREWIVQRDEESERNQRCANIVAEDEKELEEDGDIPG